MDKLQFLVLVYMYLQTAGGYTTASEKINEQYTWKHWSVK